jgi:predicted TIM-barrel fold metal-dependent hydrolase
MRVFDVHPHVVSGDLVRYPLHRLFDHVAPYVTQHPVTTEAMLAEMDEGGVAKMALVHSSMAYGYDNNYAADSAAAYPDRFASVCSIDFRANDAPQRLRYWIRERRMNGVRIFTSGGAVPDDPRWILDPHALPFWETAAELEIPVCVRLKYEAFAILPSLLERFPTVPVILEHVPAPPGAGAPPFAEAASFWALADWPTVYFKLKTSNLLELNAELGSARDFMTQCVDVFGADHIAWGSNYPASDGPLGELVETAQRELHYLSEGDREAIFCGTALALYPTLG